MLIFINIILNYKFSFYLAFQKYSRNSEQINQLLFVSPSSLFVCALSLPLSKIWFFYYRIFYILFHSFPYLNCEYLGKLLSPSRDCEYDITIRLRNFNSVFILSTFARSLPRDIFEVLAAYKLLIHEIHKWNITYEMNISC